MRVFATETRGMTGNPLTLHSPLSALIGASPVTLPLNASVREAVAVMNERRVGSVIVIEPERRLPLGIFTLRDLLRRVTLSGCDLEQPIANVMTSGLVTVRPHTTAYQAAVLMAQHGVRHLPVVDADGRLLGIVSQHDLFSLQRVGTRDLAEDIRAARSLDALRQCAADMRELARTLVAQRVGAEQLMHLLSTLNDLLTLRVIELTHDEFDLPAVRWCWIALGSEGRFEQTLSTDQDNGIIFEAHGDEAALREALVPFAHEVNARLDACGFPLCRGNIMAGNPQWCLSLDEWQSRFAGWMQVPEPQALLNAAIFFDFRPLYGDHPLAECLRDWLLAVAPANPLFLRQMTENALQCQPPLGMIRDFVFDESREFPRTLDLKKFGSRPFVDAARILSLNHGIAQTSTAARLRAVAGREEYDGDDVAAIVDGFFFIQSLRVRRQQQSQGAPAGANRLDPAQLNELDRHILKEAFKQARKLQNRLRLDFRL